MRAVRREAAAPLVTPAIVHLGFDHFSVVLREVEGRFLVRDPALGGELWMPREALDEEMSGYALIPSDATAEGWSEVSEADADAVVGHSCPPGIPDPDDCPCPESEPGMPTYSLHPTQASVLLSDAPLGYSPPRGPSVHLQLWYNHREENQPQIFPFTNLGARWTLSWASYLEEVPFTWFDEGGALAFAQPAHVAVHVPSGGVERYAYPDGNNVYPRHYRSAAVLAQVSANPVVYERRHTDGSTEVYGLADGGVPGNRRVFLTSVVDPYGQTLAFTWDAQLRLVAVTDALGQVTTLQYEDGDPLKVASVTDPFGRIARFTYDANGHLDSVTDVVNLTSRFVYGESDFIAALQTPYGTTTFRAPYLAGQYKRAIEAVDPLGACEGAERGVGVPASDQAGVRGRAPSNFGTGGVPLGRRAGAGDGAGGRRPGRVREPQRRSGQDHVAALGERAQRGQRGGGDRLPLAAAVDGLDVGSGLDGERAAHGATARRSADLVCLYRVDGAAVGGRAAPARRKCLLGASHLQRAGQRDLEPGSGGT